MENTNPENKKCQYMKTMLQSLILTSMTSSIQKPMVTRISHKSNPRRQMKNKKEMMKKKNMKTIMKRMIMKSFQKQKEMKANKKR